MTWRSVPGRSRPLPRAAARPQGAEVPRPPVPASRPSGLVGLQRLAGNRAVTALLAGRATGKHAPSGVPAVPVLPTAPVVQRVNGTVPAPPDRAKRPLTRMTQNNIHYVIDSRGYTWWLATAGRSGKKFWRLVPKSRKGRNTHGRIKSPLGRGTVRARSMKGRFGSGARYAPVRKRTAAGPAVKDSGVVAVPQNVRFSHTRTYTANMEAATGYRSATAYARSTPHAAAIGAVPFEWCHLVARGIGGSDAATNVAAGSKHVNTEQMCIERALEQSNVADLSVQIRAEMAAGSAHLARRFHYFVFKGGSLCFSRVLDGWRTEAVGWSEEQQIRTQVINGLQRGALG